MQTAYYHKKPRNIGSLRINTHLANPTQDLSILCVLKRIHLQPVLVGDIPALCPLTKFAEIGGGNGLSLSLLRKASILQSASQCRVKQNPPEQRLAQTCTLSSLQADKHRQQCMNEWAMHAEIMQHTSAPSTSH